MNTANWPPLILANAPNGASKSKVDHPALPITPAELAVTAAEIAEAGAAMIHVHVRDAAGRHLLDAEAFRDATAAIRAAVGERLVIQATSESGGRYRAGEQMAVIRAVRPEAVSAALRELVPDQASEPAAAEFFAWLRRERIATQIILYSAEEVVRYAHLKRRGVLGDGNDFPLFVLGRYTTGQVSSPNDLLPFLAAAHDEKLADPWAMCAFGPKENACAIVAAGLGGHVRVGFENNLSLPSGLPAARNADLVRLAAEGAALIGRRPATADEARTIMG
jgi:uncharacterized protein (DUF849 family)